MEAGWLAALVAVPLFFSPFSDRMFEPAKVAIVRTLAGVMCAAWLAGWLAERRPRAGRGSGRVGRRGRQGAARPVARSWVQRDRRSVERGGPQHYPLALAVLALLAANVLSTAASISPATSLVGGYERAQGLYTTASYVAIFLLAAAVIRTLRQVERAITVALVASLPVALYGVLQHYGLDPLPRDRSFAGAASSTLGNPAFLGGYLAMLVPLALARLLESAGEATVELGSPKRAAPRTRRVRPAPFVLVALYALVLAAQVGALLASETRGPALGLLGGVGVFVLLHALLRGSRRLVAGVVLAGALLVGLLVALQPVDPEPGGGSSANPTAEVRKQIWEGAVRLAVPHEPLWSASEGADRLDAVRSLVGYGPDSFYAASGHMLPAELGRLQGRTVRPDHAHNETLDALVQGGLVGMVAYLLVIGTALYVVLAALGLVRASRHRGILAAACAGGATLAAAVAVPILGRAYVGLALPAGLVLGAVAYVAMQRLSGQRDERRAWSPASHSGRLLVAVTAALSAHLIETQVGIASTTARTYFWFLAAVLVAVAGVVTSGAERAERPSSDRHETGRGGRLDAAAAPAVAAVVGALVLATLVFGFVNATTIDAFPSESTVAVVLLMIASTVFAGAIGLAEWARAGWSGRPRTSALVGTAASALLLSFTAPFLYTVDRSEEGDLPALLAAFALFVCFVVLLVLALGAALARERRRAAPSALAPASAEALGSEPRRRDRSTSLKSTAGALAAAVLLAALSVWANVRVGEADIVHAQAPRISDSRRLVERFEGAADEQPLHARARVFLADAHVSRAKLASSRALRERELGSSERALLRARVLDPFDPDLTLELAILQERAARLGEGAGEIRSHLERSLRYYGRVTRMSPGSAYVRDRRAYAQLQYGEFLLRGGDARGGERLRRAARGELRRAHAIDPGYCLTFALRGLAGTSWRTIVSDALAAHDRHAGPCGGEGLERRVGSLAWRALARAWKQAVAAGEGAVLVRRLEKEVRTSAPGERSRAAAELLEAQRHRRVPH